MPGMGSPLQTDNSTVVAAFESALVHQGLVVLAILAVLALAWNGLRAVQLRRAMSGTGSGVASVVATMPSPEPAARRLLRVAFGLLWIFDGVLQGQSAMPLGMTAQVVQPAARSSPSWVQHLVGAGVTIWNDHPVHAAASVVWIQIGIGLWLLVAPRGNWSRLAGLASAGWGSIVWIFGEAFGGIFAPGLTWLFGAPGAVIFYFAAGLCVALPERYFASPRLGRTILAAVGAFFAGMAVLQAWPGRGFWQGRVGRHSMPGTLVAMVRSMSATSQPHLLASLVADFGAFDEAHGFAVNLFVVVALGAIGCGLLGGWPRGVRVAVIAAVVLCGADWVLVEDLGVVGGVGTDPNSMVPMALVIVVGYLAMTRVPAGAEAPRTLPADPGGLASWWAALIASPTYAFRSLAALGAIAITVLGAAPMAAASVNPTADPIVSQAIDGTAYVTDVPARPFHLVDQHGRPVTLASFRGKAVALTFLDPVCTSDCPVIAQELREADAMLGAASKHVDFVAVVANPLYRSVATARAFDAAEGLEHLANWFYLTGSLPELEQAWGRYGIQLAVEPGGAMVAHSDLAYVIDATGHTRDVLDTNPGPGTSSSRSSFAGVLASTIRKVLPAS